MTGARFGTSGFNQLRGPGSVNLDMSVNRTFQATEYLKVQIRAEALNLTNTPHFANPAANVSNLQLNPHGTVRNLNGFGVSSQSAPLGRTIDQRYMRFGLRLEF